MPPLKVLILDLLLVIRFGGKDGNLLFLGSIDATFFGYGIVVGFSVVELALNCLRGVHKLLMSQEASGMRRKWLNFSHLCWSIWEDQHLSMKVFQTGLISFQNWLK